MFYKTIITILLLLCGQESVAYKTVINESWGKMEMLQQIDQYLKDTVSRDLGDLKDRVKKLESSTKGSSRNRAAPNRASARRDYSNQDFQASIRQVNQQISNNKTSIGALESSIRDLSRTVNDLQKEISILIKKINK